MKNNNKNKTYFEINEDFKIIIKDTLKDEEIENIKFISTGWTNIVYEVKTNKNSYFFRFPRDDFWTRTIIKDYEFGKFIEGKTSFKTCKLELFYNRNRPFSKHIKIKGKVLAEVMDILNEEEIKKVCYGISKFMYELHNIDYDENKIFKISKNINFNLKDYLNELLISHVDKKYIENWNNDLKMIKQDEKCLVHGDFNSSNVILDSDYNVIGIIDFGFAGYGDKYDDIARIIGRCPKNFKEYIIKEYNSLLEEYYYKNNKNNKQENNKNKEIDFNDININLEKLENKINMWNNIDTGYIDYMRKIGIYE